MMNPDSPYVPRPEYSGIAAQDPQLLQKTTTTSFTRLTNTSLFAMKALLLNTGAGDVDVSVDGTNIARTLPSGTEYEWSNPYGDRPFDLSHIYVKSGSAGYVVKVLYVS